MAKIRVAAFTVLPAAYALLREWATKSHNEVALVVTTPGPSYDPCPDYVEVVRDADSADVLVTRRPRDDVGRMIASRVDLIVSINFPFLIPREVIESASLGGINLHATPLPRYRGPNPLRMLYDECPSVGATVHRLEEQFDAGPILSMTEYPVGDWPSVDSVRVTWEGALKQAFTEGINNAINGIAGTPQADAVPTTYAARFSANEQLLDAGLPLKTLVFRFIALSLMGPKALMRLNGEIVLIEVLCPLLVPVSTPPGSILQKEGRWLTVAVLDGAIRVKTSA